MIFKVYYQESKTEVPVRKKQKRSLWKAILKETFAKSWLTATIILNL